MKVLIEDKATIINDLTINVKINFDFNVTDDSFSLDLVTDLVSNCIVPEELKDVYVVSKPLDGEVLYNMQGCNEDTSNSLLSSINTDNSQSILKITSVLSIEEKNFKQLILLFATRRQYRQA